MQDFPNIFSTFYYNKLINLPTRERKQSSTLLDILNTNIDMIQVHQEFYIFNTIQY